MANARRSPRRPPRFTGTVILLAEDIIIIDDDKDEAAPLPSPTPAVVEVAGNALAYVSAPTEASIFTFWLRLCVCRCSRGAAPTLNDARDPASFTAQQRSPPPRRPRSSAPKPAVEQPRPSRRYMEPGRAWTRERRRAWEQPSR